ncbi:MAG: U32 family peptidase, partial [Oscillospiraceae bacterium]|nr:U32 family peptidase [Oscillospiraceae bacterium]
LARELPKEEIEAICKASPIEIEVFAHGALCMCYSGQCYMSAVIGRRSGNRGLCAQPCRLPYASGARGSEYPLSLKDNCLIYEMRELERIGVKCVKIEGRMRPPEYAAVVTGVYSRVIREGTPPTKEELAALETAFSRQGFTDGYFTDRRGPEMLGVRESGGTGETQKLFAAAKKHYLNNEFQRIPVWFVASVKEGAPIRLAGCDDRGHTAEAEGSVPEPAFHRELTQTSVQTQLYKTGGTPFICRGARSEVDPGLALPAAALNEMRRSVLKQLLRLRAGLDVRPEAPYSVPAPIPNGTAFPCFTVSVVREQQLSPELAALRPRVLYVPLEAADTWGRSLEPFLQDSGVSVCVALPRVLHGREKEDAARLLRRAKGLGITEALAGNLGHILFAANEGFAVRGDFGLNLYNSQSLAVAKDLQLLSATVSFEARMEQIRDLSKCMDTEMIVYGRLPLMITENCIVKNAAGVCSCRSFSGLTDRNGFLFPVLREYGCRSALYNSKKLFLADRAGDWKKIGLWGARLSFTTENRLECVSVAERYLGRSDYVPNGVTHGLYYRGVE